MATNQEMFAFLAQFGPMLGELAAHVTYLERRIEALESADRGASDPASTSEPKPPAGKFEFMGQEFDMDAMLAGGMPEGGFNGLMKRALERTPKTPTASGTTPPPASSTPPVATGGSTPNS